MEAVWQERRPTLNVISKAAAYQWVWRDVGRQASAGIPIKASLLSPLWLEYHLLKKKNTRRPLRPGNTRKE